MPFALLLALLSAGSVGPADTVYQARFVRAAPGRLLELLDAIGTRRPVYEAAGEHPPIVLRHAQGDQWDLMLLEPIPGLAERFGAERAARWRRAAAAVGFDEDRFARQTDQWISWREELFVTGPPVAALDSALARAGYFHLEIFQALAGRRDSLLRERAMENDFLTRIGRAPNFVFRRLAGAAWDLFTLGLYRDLQHYAEPGRLPADAEEAAARAAGFRSRADIGPYLRRFIAGHHDTLGSVVR